MRKTDYTLTKFCVDCSNFRDSSPAGVGMCVRGTKRVEFVDPVRGKSVGYEHSFVGVALDERTTGGCGMDGKLFSSRPSTVIESRSIGMSIIRLLRKWRGK
jgi:hypothetical protein